MAASGALAIIPLITSSLGFSARRYGKGNASDNALVSIMDYDIAIGQGAKAVGGGLNIAKESSNVKLAEAAAKREKELSVFLKSGILNKGARNVIRFTMNNINPLIGATELIKTACADDKQKALLENGCAFGTMLIGENIIKDQCGIGQLARKDGKFIFNSKPTKIKKYKIVRSMDTFCQNRTLFGKSLKYLPKAGKGIALIGGSILSYTCGHKLGSLLNDGVNYITNAA